MLGHQHLDFSSPCIWSGGWYFCTHGYCHIHNLVGDSIWFRLPQMPRAGTKGLNSRWLSPSYIDNERSIKRYKLFYNLPVSLQGFLGKIIAYRVCYSGCCVTCDCNLMQVKWNPSEVNQREQDTVMLSVHIATSGHWTHKTTAINISLLQLQYVPSIYHMISWDALLYMVN